MKKDIQKPEGVGEIEEQVVRKVTAAVCAGVSPDFTLEEAQAYLDLKAQEEQGGKPFTVKQLFSIGNDTVKKLFKK